MTNGLPDEQNATLELEEALDQVARKVNEINRGNGWDIPTRLCFRDDPKLLSSHLALVHSEVSEALEALRAQDISNFAEELADVVIRVMNIADGVGISIGFEVLRKLEINRGRGHRHGGKAL